MHRSMWSGQKRDAAFVERAACTFSHTTNIGRRMRIASRISTHRLERVPSTMPVIPPALLMS